MRPRTESIVLDPISRALLYADRFAADRASAQVSTSRFMMGLRVGRAGTGRRFPEETSGMADCVPGRGFPPKPIPPAGR